jgi:hypothetical protein
MSAQLSPCFSKLRQVGEKGEGENEWGIKDRKKKLKTAMSKIKEEKIILIYEKKKSEKSFFFLFLLLTRM